MNTTANKYAPVIAAAQAAASSEYEGAKALAAFLGTSPTYDTWEAVRVHWIKAYADKLASLAKDCSVEAGQKAWERQAKAMETFFALEKPKSPSKAATAKAASRTSAKDTAAKVVKQHAPAKLTAMQVSEKAQAMLSKAVELPAAEKAKVLAEARILTDEAIKRQKAAEKAQADKAKAATKEQRQALAKIVGALEGEELLALAYAASHKAELVKWYKARLADMSKKLKAA